MRQLYDNFIADLKKWHIFASTALAASRLEIQLLAASSLVSTNELAASRLGRQLLAASRLNIIS